MALKQELRNWYSNLIQAGDSHGLRFLSKWFSGSTAAAISTVVCYPLDFARTRLATDVERSSKVKYHSILKWDACSRWSFGPNSAWRSIETMTIGMTHPTLTLFLYSVQWNN